MQSQLLVLACQQKFAYFVVWTNEDIDIEIINFCQILMSEVIVKLEHFYKLVILPEVLSKWFTQPRVQKRQCDVEENANVEPCYCKTVDPSKTSFKCANVNCTTRVFHKECLGLKNIPKKGWNCPGCRILKRSKKM